MGNSLRRPSTTDRYELRELICQGGIGLVYRAWDREAEREAALKALRSVGPEELYRLKNEFRALAGLSHPNLAQLYELTVVADECFFTMELVEGANLVDHVRGGGTRCDFERLGACLPQLAAGLAALHGAGKLHRDIKPSNVLVAAGRVVMLDFGLVTALASRRASESTGSLVGTLAYMAPEQLWGCALSAATDWYALGIMLYEALTGRLPFTGAALLLDRHKAMPPSPRSLAAEIPGHLDALTMRLLRPAPEERPPEAELLRLLGACQVRPAEPRALAPPSGAGPFVGRAAELGLLSDAFEATRRGAFVSVEVQGASGVGKTALLRRFLDLLEAEDRALVLRARCHPHEAVPFKAVDGLVDGLSHFLVRQPPAELQSLLPRNAAALARLFPVLARVPGLSGTRREPSAEG